MGQTVEEKLNLFYEMIRCNHHVFYWVYDAKQNLISAPKNARTLNTVFEHIGCKSYVFDYGKQNSEPLILSAPGILWAAGFEKENDELKKIHVMGPVKIADVSPDVLGKMLGKYDIPMAWKREFVNSMAELPIIPSTFFFQYAIMQHYCITGEKLSVSSLHYQQSDIDENEGIIISGKKDRKNTYLIEQELLHMVQSGNMNYKKALDKASNISSGIRIEIGDPLRQAKNSVIVFISLCVRAAIRGGFPTDSSYARGDAYIESVEKCNTVSEVTHISHMMYEDFIGCVHNQRISNNYSKEIAGVCEYISFHVQDRIETSELAHIAGYSDYYLTRKFKTEVGLSIAEYIRISKINYAKMLLISSDESVQEICERLALNSRGHFIEHFKKIVGCTPREYRERNHFI